MYAVIEAGGAQHRIQVGIFSQSTESMLKGQIWELDRLGLDRVLLLAENGLKVGTPYVSDAKVVWKWLTFIEETRLMCLSTTGVIVPERWVLDESDHGSHSID